MKKIKNNFLALAMLFLSIVGAYRPNVWAMESCTTSSSGITAFHGSTDEILYIVNRFLTKENLQNVSKKRLVGSENAQAILNIAYTLVQILPEADNYFGDVPGFRAYEQKILQNLRSFIACIDANESDRLIEQASILGEIDKLKSAIEKLEPGICAEFSNMPFTTQEYSRWINEKYPIDKKVERSDEGSHSQSLEDDFHSQCSKNSSHRKMHKSLKKALTIKQNYLRCLAKLLRLDLDSVVASYENGNMGLTRGNSYVIEKDDFERLHVVKNGKGKRVLKKEMPAPEYFNGLAHSLLGTLYELEAAFIARAHGEKIIAFGPKLTLFFDPSSSDQSDLIATIMTNKFLKPAFDKKTSMYTLMQEFDLVTSEKIIECKNLNRGGMDAYIDEFLREQFMVTYATKATSQEIDLGGDQLDVIHFVLKPVVCYARYMKDFLKEEKMYQEGRRSETPPRQQECLSLETLDKEKLLEEEISEIRDLVLRTCKESRHRELEVAQVGFSYWNGSIYHHVERIMHSYEMPTIAEISKLKKFIQVVGKGNFALHIVAPQRLHEDIRHRFNNFGICREAAARSSSHKRSHSEDLTHSPEFRSQSQSPVEEEELVAMQEDEKVQQKLGNFRFLRSPIKLETFDFCESGVGSATFGSPQKPKPNDLKASTYDSVQTRNRLRLLPSDVTYPRGNFTSAFSAAARMHGDKKMHNDESDAI